MEDNEQVPPSGGNPLSDFLAGKKQPPQAKAQPKATQQRSGNPLADFISVEEPPFPQAPSPQTPPQNAAGGGAPFTASPVSQAPPAPPSGTAGRAGTPLAPQPAQVAKATGPDRGVLFRNYWSSEAKANELRRSIDEAQSRLPELRGTGLDRGQEQAIGNMVSEYGIYSDAVKKGKALFEKEINASASEAVDSLGDSAYMDKDGIKYPDPSVLMGMAKQAAKKYGVEDTDFERILYHRMKAKADGALIQKDADALFEEKKASVLDPAMKKMAEMFKDDDIEQAKASAEIDSIRTSIEESAKQDVNAIDSEVRVSAEQINASLGALNSEYESSVDGVKAAFNRGEMSADDANAMMAQMHEAYKENFSQAEAAMGALQAKAVSDVARINQRYNRVFQDEQRRIIGEAQKRLKAATDRFQKEYGDSDEARQLRSDLKKLYGTSWDEAVRARGASIQEASDKRWESDASGMFTDLSYAFVKRFAESTISGLGGAIKGLATTLGDNVLYAAGEEMEQITNLPQAKSSKLSDLLEGRNLAQLSGQLAGGMAPSLAAAAGVSAATGGAGAPVAVQLLASSAAGWGAETVDLAGRAYDDVLRDTGSREKASKAANDTFKAQVQLMPAYAFEGLPFVGKALDFVPTRAGRALAGAATEYGTELLQEIPQNIAEENIRAGREPYEDFFGSLKDMSDNGKLKELLISMAPITVLGGAGPLVGKSPKAQLNDAVKKYLIESEIAKEVPEAAGQWLDAMQRNQGAQFTRAVIASLFTGGSIDQAKATKLLEMHDGILRLRDEASRIGLNEEGARIYAALGIREASLRQRAEQEQNPMTKKVLESAANDVFKAIEGFSNEGSRNYVEIHLGDGDGARSIVLDNQSAAKLIRNPSFISEVTKSGDFAGVDFIGDAAQELAAEFQSRIKAESDSIEADKRRRGEKVRSAASRKRRPQPRISINGTPLNAEPTASEAPTIKEEVQGVPAKNAGVAPGAVGEAVSGTAVETKPVTEAAKTEEDAVQIESPTSMGPYPGGTQGAGRDTGSEALGRGEQGTAPAAETQQEEVGLSSKSLQEAFGYTPEVADATVAIADAMGLDKKKIKVVKGGESAADALFQEESAGWRSRLDEAVSAKGSTMPASQWKTWMEARAKEGSFSMEEAKWTGLSDWLASKGNEKVTPQQVREFLKENRVKVEVVEKSDEAPKGAVYRVDDSDIEDVEDLGYGPWRVTFRGGNEQIVTGDFLDEAQARRLAIEQENESADEYEAETSESKDPTKFSQYQLPGGSRYREVLVTLPPRPIKNKNSTGQEGWKVEEVKPLNDAGVRHVILRDADGNKLAEYTHARRSDRSVMDRYLAEVGKTKQEQATFRSSHFDEPNILVHLRLNDRTGPNGEKILFIEELQSDFGQSLRKLEATIDQNFDDIVEKMKADGVLKKRCP